MTALETAMKQAKDRPARVVFPEWNDPRICKAVEELSRRGLALPTPVGPQSQAQLEVLLAQRPIKRAIAERMLTRPLIRAAAMVACGEADVMVAGAVYPTRKVIEAASLVIGLSDGVQTPSSFMLMQMPDGRAFVLADCAVNVAPDFGVLVDIAQTSATSARALFGHADVALLSYSTGRSGLGPSVDLMHDVANATGFSGPLQVDAALNTQIAAQKGVSGAKTANTLIFPDLNAGNIAYKLLQELAGAQAIGPVLQGFKKPVCDLSRGATTEDIVAGTLIAAALSQAT